MWQQITNTRVLLEMHVAEVHVKGTKNTEVWGQSLIEYTVKCTVEEAGDPT